VTCFGVTADPHVVAAGACNAYQRPVAWPMKEDDMNVEDLPLFLKHDFITFGGAIFDMPSAADERCRKREEWARSDGDPFRPEATH